MYTYARRRGEPASGLHGEISVTDSASGRVCRSAERRIHPVVEAGPDLLVPVAAPFKTNPRSAIRLHHAAYAAFRRLKAAAEGDGIPANLLTIVSGYRSVATQKALWETALRRYGSPEKARVYVAPPGGSPHHTGRAIDFYLGLSNDSRNIPALRRTSPYHWLVCNAERFGFTPYAAEPWHWEYNPPGLDPGRRPLTTAEPPSQAAARPVPPAPRPSAPVSRATAPSPAPRSAPAPGSDPLAAFSSSERKALRLTTHFEGGRPLQFDALSGDFDGMGISFGLLQWNIGTGSLQPLLKTFLRDFPSRFDAVFGPDSTAVRSMLALSLPLQLQWAKSINDSRNRLIQPWESHFRALGADPEFQRIELRVARQRMDDGILYTQRFHLSSERALAFMFDTVTGSGPCWLFVHGRLQKVNDGLAAQSQATGGPLSERQILMVITGVMADTVKPRWRENVRRRKECIVNGRGRVHGEDIDLARQFGIGDNPHDAVASAGARLRCAA